VFEACTKGSAKRGASFKAGKSHECR
jgi:hypothetical protein